MLSEWYYNGDMTEAEFGTEPCQLCSHPDLKYQFGITNSHTNHKLFVGSECINRFELSGVGNYGEFIDSQETKKKLSYDRRKLIKDVAKRRVLNCLILLNSKTTNSQFNFEKTLEYFKERGKFSPKHLGLIFWKLDTNKISYKKADFKVSLQRNREKEQLLEMENWKLEKIWQSLTSQQKKWHKKNSD